MQLLHILLGEVTLLPPPPFMQLQAKQEVYREGILASSIYFISHSVSFAATDCEL